MSDIPRVTPVFKSLLVVTLAIGTAFLLGCGDTEGDTIIIDGLDCGLVRDDLIGTWEVTFTVSGLSSLNDCTGADPGLSGNITTTSTPSLFSDVDVFGSDGSSSFKVVWLDAATGSNTVLGDLTGSVQADSCLALFRVWEADDAAYVQCFGTFDRVAGTILGACDSAEVDTDADDVPDTTCSLGSIYDVVVDLF